MTEDVISKPVERLSDDTIRFERLFDAPVETVWRYLAEADLRSQWFAGGTDARGEGEIELRFDHDLLSTDDVPYPEAYAKYTGAVNRETVVRFEPPQVLAFTFGEGKQGVATFELSPENGGTRLVLTHSGIKSGTGAQDFGSGWNSHLTVLQEKLAGRGVRDFWELHARSKEAVAEVLG